MLIRLRNDSHHHSLNDTLPCVNISLLNSTYDNCTNDLSSNFNNDLFPNSILIIFVLSILSILGVCFMIFGPLQRSEAYKRVENFTFGRDPIFNIDHGNAPRGARHEESNDFADD